MMAGGVKGDYGVHWTDSEVEILKAALQAELPRTDIVKMLPGRSLASVKSKIEHLRGGRRNRRRTLLMPTAVEIANDDRKFAKYLDMMREGSDRLLLAYGEYYLKYHAAEQRVAA